MSSCDRRRRTPSNRGGTWWRVRRACVWRRPGLPSRGRDILLGPPAGREPPGRHLATVPPSLERRNVNARQRGRVTSNGDKRPATPERQGDTWDVGDGMKTEQSDRIIERRFDRELLPRAELQVGRMPRDHHQTCRHHTDHEGVDRTFPALADPSSEGHPRRHLSSRGRSTPSSLVRTAPGHSRVHMALRLNGPRELEDGSRPRCSIGDASASK